VARTRASLEFLALLLMPADAAKRGVLIEATKDWELEAADVPREADVVVWGGWPPRGRHSVLTSILSALKRELALRTLRSRLPDGFVQTRVHRLSPVNLRPRTGRGRAKAAIFSGALVEIQRPPGVCTVLDAVADAAGIRVDARPLHPGSGVSAWLRGRGPGGEVLLRFGATGSQADPHGAARCLERLEAAGIRRVPRVVSGGRRDGVSWSAESILPGATPRRLTPELAVAAGAFLASLPVSEGPPAAWRDDLLAIREAFPSRSREIDALAAGLEVRLASLPSVLRHGDLWAGNLLVERGSFTGVIDWDAWHPEGVPGADLMYLGVMDRALSAGPSCGRIWSDRPWRLPIVRHASPAYWSRLGLSPGEDLLQAVALAGWAAQVASALRRAPELASTRRWVLRNVEPVLAPSSRR
jgi:phosphotransferase family enzyme